MEEYEIIAEYKDILISERRRKKKEETKENEEK